VAGVREHREERAVRLAAARDRHDGAAPPGYCHFPEYGDEYFRQLTAEQLVTHKNRRGFIRLEWELIPGRQNHVLDARIYARAAAMLAGLDRFTDSDWTAREQMLAPNRSADAPAAPKTDAPKRARRGCRRASGG
jgi:phage terminase large subunit GpA-like protein